MRNINQPSGGKLTAMKEAPNITPTQIFDEKKPIENHKYSESKEILEQYSDLFEYLEGNTQQLPDRVKLNSFRQSKNRIDRAKILLSLKPSDAIRCIIDYSGKKGYAHFIYLINKLDYYDAIIKNKCVRSEKNGKITITEFPDKNAIYANILDIKKGLYKDLLKSLMLNTPEDKIVRQARDKAKYLSHMPSHFIEYKFDNFELGEAYPLLNELFENVLMETKKKYPKTNHYNQNQITIRQAATILAKSMEYNDPSRGANSPYVSNPDEAIAWASLESRQAQLQLRGMRQKIMGINLHNIKRFIGQKGNLIEKAIELHFLFNHRKEEYLIDWINEAPFATIEYAHELLKNKSCQNTYIDWLGNECMSIDNDQILLKTIAYTIHGEEINSPAKDKKLSEFDQNDKDYLRSIFEIEKIVEQDKICSNTKLKHFSVEDMIEMKKNGVNVWWLIKIKNALNKIQLDYPIENIIHLSQYYFDLNTLINTLIRFSFEQINKLITADIDLKLANSIYDNIKKYNPNTSEHLIIQKIEENAKILSENSDNLANINDFINGLNCLSLEQMKVLYTNHNDNQEIQKHLTPDQLMTPCNNENATEEIYNEKMEEIDYSYHEKKPISYKKYETIRATAQKHGLQYSFDHILNLAKQIDDNIINLYTTGYNVDNLLLDNINLITMIYIENGENIENTKNYLQKLYQLNQFGYLHESIRSFGLKNTWKLAKECKLDKFMECKKTLTNWNILEINSFDAIGQIAEGKIDLYNDLNYFWKVEEKFGREDALWFVKNNLRLHNVYILIDEINETKIPELNTLENIKAIAKLYNDQNIENTGFSLFYLMAKNIGFNDNELIKYPFLVSPLLTKITI